MVHVNTIIYFIYFIVIIKLSISAYPFINPYAIPLSNGNFLVIHKYGISICNSHSIEINPFKNKNTSFKYLISTNNSNSNNKLSALKHIEFEIIKPNKCCDCGVENSNENPLLFCKNDNCFFCTQCDKTWHEQKEKKALSLHFRTNKFNYTLSYFGNCPLLGHLNKPFLYFDEKNKTCLCVKCVESLNSEERVENDISYIEDYLKEKEKKEDFLNSRIDSVCNDINQRLKYAESIWNKIDEYEKNIVMN